MTASPQSQTITAPGQSGIGEAWARPKPGARLGRYVLDREVGAGGMGVVYAAHDPSLRRHVAVKVIRPRTLHDPGALFRFEQEARMLAAVQHPAVIDIYDVGIDDGRPFIVMPLLPGRTLRDWLAGRPPIAAVLQMFDRIAAGLSAAHAAGVLHCDFKPGNVMLTHDEQPVVADFGLARLDREETHEGESERTYGGSGTPAYMAPELHRLAPHSVRTDIYAFHVALVEALAGCRPFEGRDGRALLADKEEGVTAAILERLPRRLRRRVRQGLAPSPEDRLRTLEPLRRESGGVRTAVLATAVIGLLGASTAGATPRAPTCAERATAYPVEASVWTDTSVDGAARATVLHTNARMDAWRGEWSRVFETACEAEETEQLECLSRLRVSAESWMRPPTNGDAFSRALAWSGAASSLPRFETCTQATDAGGGAHRARLEEVRVLLDRGHLREATAQGLALAEAASHDFDTGTALLARTLAAESLAEQHDYRQAEQLLLGTIETAEATGRWLEAAVAGVQLVWVLGVGDTDIDAARKRTRQVSAWAARAGDAEHLHAGALMELASVLERHGDLDGAEEVGREALALAQAHRDDARFDRVRQVAVAQRLSLGAKRNDNATVLALDDALDDLERRQGPYARLVLTGKAALSHAQGTAGRFEDAVEGFDALADRYAEMGEGMAFWVHQTRVNAAEFELRAGDSQAALARLEPTCPQMARLRTPQQTNVLICDLVRQQAQAASGAPVELDDALDTLGVIEGRFGPERFPVQQARTIVATIGVSLGQAEAVRSLFEERSSVPALEVERAWLRAQVSGDVAEYAAVCEVASDALRPDLCARAQDHLR